MRNSSRIVVRFILLLMLVIALVVGSSSWVAASLHKTNEHSSVALPVRPDQVVPANTNLARQQRRKKSKAERINYDLVIKDIVQIFKWLDSPEMTAQQLAARISDYECDDPCPIKLSGERTFYNGMPVFSGINSEKYIGGIEIPQFDQKSGIVGLQIFLRKAYKSKFSPDILHSLLSSSSQPKKLTRDFNSIHCDGVSDDYDCPQRYFYDNDIKTKFFVSSKPLSYRVRTDFYRYKHKPDQIQSILLSLERA
jgi:hypothetical protein